MPKAKTIQYTIRGISMEPDPAFDRALEDQRQIDWDMWK
jgi:hypothetical protein